jgi:hypothetical protein
MGAGGIDRRGGIILRGPTDDGWEGRGQRTWFSQCLVELDWILPRSLRSMADVRAARTGGNVGHSGRDDTKKEGHDLSCPYDGGVTQEGGIKPPLHGGLVVNVGFGF